MDLDVRGARKLFKNREQLLNEQRWIEVKFDIYEQIKKRALDGFQKLTLDDKFDSNFLSFIIIQLRELGYTVKYLSTQPSCVIEISWE